MKYASFRNLSFVQASLFFMVSMLVLSSCEKDVRGGSGDALAQKSVQPAIENTSLSEAGIDSLGVVAWFDFDSGKLTDKSPYHNIIDFNNATNAPDRHGVINNAYYFNGKSSYMRVKNSPSLNPTGGITLFAIVNFNDFYAGACHGNRILNKAFDDTYPGIYYLGANDDYYLNGMGCSQPVDKAHETFSGVYGSVGIRDTTQFIQTSHWYHIVFTYGNGISKFYIDGTLVETSFATSTPFTDNGVYLFIGTSDKGNVLYPYWFNGRIDQIGIFNKALSDAQVARLSRY